jgi:hypothetical protein
MTLMSEPVPKDPIALENRRREIITTLQTQYPTPNGGSDHPDVPLDLLRELAFIVQKLRRPTSGPPRKPGAPTKRKTYTVDDLD